MSTPSRDREPGGGRPGMRKRKETKYREGSESSGSDGARKSTTAEKKRDQRRRQKEAKKNLGEEQSTSAKGTTNANLRANEEVQTPRTRQQSRLQTETPERTISIEQDIRSTPEPTPKKSTAAKKREDQRWRQNEAKKNLGTAQTEQSTSAAGTTNPNFRANEEVQTPRTRQQSRLQTETPERTIEIEQDIRNTPEPTPKSRGQNTRHRETPVPPTPKTRKPRTRQSETPQQTDGGIPELSAIIEEPTPRTGPHRKCRMVTPARDEPQPGPSNVDRTPSGRPQRKCTVKKEVAPAAVEVQEVTSRNTEELDPPSAIIEEPTPRTGPHRKCRMVTPARDEPQPGPSNVDRTPSGRPQRKCTVKKEVAPAAVEVQEVTSRNTEELDPPSPPEEEAPSPMDSDDSDYFNSQKQKTPHQKTKRKQQLTASQKRIRDSLAEEERVEIARAISQKYQNSRDQLSDEQKNAIREADRIAHAQHREKMTPAQKISANERKRNARRLANREWRLARDYEQDPIEYNLGTLSLECSHCKALFFQGEESTTDGTYNPCCRNGRVTRPLFEQYPEELRILFTSNTPASNRFFKHVRKYNAAMSFASMECKMAKPPTGTGPYVFKIHGEIRHSTSPAVTAPGQTPAYGQLFFIDESVAVDTRMSRPANKECDPMTMRDLTQIIRAHHEFAREYQTLREVYRKEEVEAEQENRQMQEVRLVFHTGDTPDPRRYNAPRVPEVAVVYVGPGGEVPSPFSYVIQAKSGHFSTIPTVSRVLDPSIYPFYFLKAHFGWHTNILRNRPEPTGLLKKVSQKDNYCWYLSIRHSFSPIHYGRALFQQFMVGSWINTEQCRLNFIKNNQKILRSEFYNEVRDFVADGQSGAVGSKIVLPASFTSSPRYMLAQYHDAMTIVARFGKPDLFLTFTSNPKWPEITANLKEGQSSADRPDLVSRVFRMKLNELIDDIWMKQIFGEVTAYIYTVEWQKRGLPHAHMLITLASEDKPRTAEDVDAIISAEIPENASRLKELVATHMIHRDCGPGAPCWVNAACSKRFPKEYQENTDVDRDGYPLYRRRDNKTTEYGNQWVVPHSPYLLLKYNAHINLEICSVIHAAKYLYKYVYKGSDKAQLELKQKYTNADGVVDEIAQHLDARYVCPPEAFHRLFSYELHGRSNPVIELSVHEEGKHSICFAEGEEREALERNQTTTLMAYFAFNTLTRQLKANGRLQDLKSPVDPHTIPYTRFPEHFTFIKKEGKWKVKARANRNIGRMHSVYPSQEERYSIRLLLLHRTGDCSYAELFTVNGVQCQTAKEAALAMGLIKNPDHFNQAMYDANEFTMPNALRSVFACLLSFDGTSSAQVMFDEWKGAMSEDYKNSGMYTEVQCFALAYFDILEMCNPLSVQTSFREKVRPPLDTRPQIVQPIRVVNHAEIGQEMYHKLNPTQLTPVDAVLNNLEKLIFLDGPGGSGKTFTYECIFHLLRAIQKSVVCLAWTGIAAHLLSEGRTVASYFKLNVDNNCESSRLKPNSEEGRAVAAVDVFIIDECSMISHQVIDTIDRTLRDLTQVHNLPFGGKTVLIGGDFRQVLPIPNNMLGETAYQCCIKLSAQFPLFRTYSLTENMRAANSSADFKQFLLSIGEDSAEKDEEGRIEIPDDMLSTGDLINEVFDTGFDDVEELSTRAILSPKNINVEDINLKILNRMSGTSRTFYSIDCINQTTDDTLQLSEEFLHSLRPANLPPHKLELKVGCIVMLIRNLNVKEGLCNGTRLQVDVFGRQNAIQCSFINGPRKGEKVIIPRIDLISSKGRGLSFELSRRQFPFKLAFAMTINKAQGQSLDRAIYEFPSNDGHRMGLVSLWNQAE